MLEELWIKKKRKRNKIFMQYKFKLIPSFLIFLKFLVTIKDIHSRVGQPLWKHERLATGKYNRSLFLAFNPCTSKLVWKIFWLSTTNIIKDNIQWHNTGKSLAFEYFSTRGFSSYTRHDSQETHRSPSQRTAADPRLRPLSYWDLQ